MTMQINRRAVLAGGAAMAALSPTAAPAQAPQPLANPFAALRSRWITMLTGNGVVDASRTPYAAIVAGIGANARGWWATMADPSTDPASLWTDPLSKVEEREYNTRVSTDRLRVIALAWATPGSDFSGRLDVADRLVRALAWLEHRRYSMVIERWGNWWEWEIGIPLALLDLLILLREPLQTQSPGLHDRLATAIERFTPLAFAGTAANRVWRSHVVMLRAIAMEDAEALIEARAAIPTTFVDVVEGDGFHRDGSFVQHDDLGYTGGYGRDLLTRSALLFYLLEGSPWAFTRGQMLPLRARLLQAFVPLMYRGAIMDMVRGRNATRANLSDIDSGQTISIATLYLASVLQDSGLKAVAKGWIAGERGIANILAYDPKLPAYWLTPHMAWLIVEAIGDQNVPPRAEPIETVAFAEMVRMVHRRPRFTLALAMNSARIRNFEIANGENLTGWYAGWGTTYVYRGGQPNYADDYWPTVDPYRLPGITLDKRPRPFAKVVGQNESLQVGTLAHDGVGLAGMLNSTDKGSFTARVSWFTVGDAVLCIGSGIRSSVEEPVETVIANEVVAKPATALVVEGQSRALAAATPLPLDDARWFHLGEAGGVILPEGGRLRALSDTRTHAWSEINRQGASPTDPRTRSYLTVWLDHGLQPTAGSYAYILLPAASLAQTRAAASRPPLRVLHRSEQVHVAEAAMEHERITACIFWAAAATPDGMQASAPLLVTMRRRGRALTLALADPLPAQSGDISLTLPLRGLDAGLLDPALRVEEVAGTTVIHLNRADLRGRTVIGSFML